MAAYHASPLSRHQQVFFNGTIRIVRQTLIMECWRSIKATAPLQKRYAAETVPKENASFLVAS